MENKENFRRNIIILIIFIILLLFVGVPLTINMLFTLESDGIFRAKWHANDALAYAGQVLSTVGALTVSGLALIQTHKLNKKMEYDKIINTKRPYFIIDKVFHDEEEVKFYKNSWKIETEKIGKIKIRAKNIGEGVALDFFYKDYFGRRSSWDICQTVPKDDIIEINVNSINRENLEISYKNIYGCCYYQYIKISIQENTIESGEIEEIEINYVQPDTREEINEKIKVPSDYKTIYTILIKNIAYQKIKDVKPTTAI